MCGLDLPSCPDTKRDQSAVEYQRTDETRRGQKRHCRQAIGRSQRADDRTRLDRGLAVRHRPEVGRQRCAGEISFRQQGRAVAGAIGARRRHRDIAARIFAGAADHAVGEIAPAYRRHHPRLSPVPLYEPADPLSAARELALWIFTAGCSQKASRPANSARSIRCCSTPA